MDYWIQFNQCCLWAISRLFIILTFSRRKVYLQSTALSKQYGYVVAANHQTRLDPFVIFGSMSLRSYLKLTPVRFMAYRAFFQVYLYRIFMQSWGAFPNKEVLDLDYGLPLSTRILADKGTIVIHPEGMRVKPGQQVEPKRGVAVMAAEPDVRLILCKIVWHEGILPRVSVIISEPRDCTNLTPQQIMDQIYSLS